MSGKHARKVRWTPRGERFLALTATLIVVLVLIALGQLVDLSETLLPNDR